MTRSKRFPHALIGPFVVMLAVMYAVAGNPVPARSEFLYVLRVFRTYHPSYLPTDWTFSQGAPEHFLFNHVFGLLGLVLPIEALGWVGRLVAWSSIAWLLLRLAPRLSIRPWTMTLATVLWLGIGQALVADSWMVGGFEASNFGYIFLVATLILLIDGRARLGGLSLGLCASFHPSIGLWGGLSAIAAHLLVDRPSIRKVLELGAFATLGALPGIVATAPVVFGAHAAGLAEWKLLAIDRMPFHLDPLTWRARDLITLPVLLLFVWYYVRATSAGRAWRLIAWFLTASALVFAGGFLCRITGRYTWLSTFPFRVFPLFTPLVFFAAVCAWHTGPRPVPPRLGAVAGLVVALMLLPDPLSIYAKGLSHRHLRWARGDTDVKQCYAWVAGHTPSDAIGMVPPPLTLDAWYWLGRGLVVTTHYPTYSDVREWHARAQAFGGPFRAAEGRDERAMAFFESIPMDEMAKLLARYGATFLVTRATYAMAPAFESGAYHVYLFANAGASSGNAPDESALAWSSIGTTR